MFNTKNLIILCISITISAFITQFTTLAGLTAFFFNGFLAIVLMQVIQSIKTESIAKYFADRKAVKAAAKKASQSASKAASDPNRETGTVKWFDSNKGYGFITRSMGEDIFVHFRSIKGNGYRSLYEGQAVDFLVTEGSKGPQAEDIHIVK
jgi:CspA family cold shock protein